MSVLLNFFSDAGWFVAILTILVVVIIHFVKKADVVIFEREKDIKFSEGDLTLIDSYMDLREVIFYEYLLRSIPSTCVAFPKVGVDVIVKPKGSKNSYNSILNRYVDYVVFNKTTMQPVLYVDLYDDSINEQIIKEEDKNVENALKAVKLPKISIKVSENDKYDVDSLKYEIANAIDPVNLALLKKS